MDEVVKLCRGSVEEELDEEKVVGDCRGTDEGVTDVATGRDDLEIGALDRGLKLIGYGPDDGRICDEGMVEGWKGKGVTESLAGVEVGTALG